MRTRLVDIIKDEVLDLLFAEWTESATSLAFEYWVEEEYPWYVDNHKEFIMRTRLIDILKDEVLDALFAAWSEEGTQLAFEFWVEENYPWYAENC